MGRGGPGEKKYWEAEGVVQVMGRILLTRDRSKAGKKWVRLR